MKKQLLAITIFSASFAVNAQTYFSEDFEGGTLTANNAWTTQVVADPDAQSLNWVWATATGLNFAKATNYVGGANHTADLWLISPSIDLSAATNPNLDFDMTKRYAGDDMIVWISQDYSGSGAPSSATWDNVTSLFTLDANTGSWAFVNSGQGDLTTYAGGSIYLAFQYIGGTTDGSTWEVDNISLIEGTIAPPSTVSIASVQATTGGDLSDELGNVVSVGGRVSAIKTGAGFYIQDNPGAWNGIYVYDFGDHVVAIGDSVILTGTVDEYAPGASAEKATQIKTITEFSNEGSYTPYPSAILTTQNVNNEMYESVLVVVDNATCTAVLDGFNEWSVNDGSGNVKVDDFLYLTSPTPVLNNVYSITGVITHSFATYKMLPRDANDVVLTSGAGIDEIVNDKVSVYPNPSSGTVNVTNINGETVKVYNSLGQLVLSTKNNQFNLKSGLYFVKVGTSTNRLIVR